MPTNGKKKNAVFVGFDKLTMSHTMHVFGYSPHAISLNHMVLITGFGSGMVDFDVNFPELSDADVLVEPDMKQAVNVSASTRFVAPLSETGVKKLIDSQRNVN